MSYNKTLKQLEIAQNSILALYSLTLETGIMPSGVAEEDGLPWLEVYGKLKIDKVNDFIQELSNTMGIMILLNDTSISRGITTITAVMDIDINNIHTDEDIIPALSLDPDAKEFMEGYGELIIPLPKSYR